LDEPSFDALRRDALILAANLATQPDVRGLLKLQSDVKAWDSTTRFTYHPNVDILLTELEGFIDQARSRQLDRDRDLLLKYPRQP
jgi:hypothetical protein